MLASICGCVHAALLFSGRSVRLTRCIKRITDADCECNNGELDQTTSWSDLHACPSEVSRDRYGGVFKCPLRKPQSRPSPSPWLAREPLRPFLASSPVVARVKSAVRSSETPLYRRPQLYMTSCINRTRRNPWPSRRQIPGAASREPPAPRAGQERRVLNRDGTIGLGRDPKAHFATTEIRRLQRLPPLRVLSAPNPPPSRKACSCGVVERPSTRLR